MSRRPQLHLLTGKGNPPLILCQQAQSAAEGGRSTEQGSDNAVELLVIESALIAGFSKILAEKLIRLCGADTEDVLAAEQAKEE